VRYAEDHLNPKVDQQPMLPSGSRDHLPFPPVAAWEWRARWAPLKLEAVLAWAKGENVCGPCQ